MKNHEFLDWLADRLVHVYGENENTDFVLKVRELAKVHRTAAAIEQFGEILARK